MLPLSELTFDNLRSTLPGMRKKLMDYLGMFLAMIWALACVGLIASSNQNPHDWRLWVGIAAFPSVVVSVLWFVKDKRRQ